MPLVPRSAPLAAAAPADAAAGFDPGNTSATSSQCTFNLHLLMDRSTDQVKERGFTFKNLELWLERFLGVLVKRLRYRVTSNPEASLAQEYLILGAQQLLAAKLHREGHDQPLLKYQQCRALQKAKQARAAAEEGGGLVLAA